ncbi:hypothetical protein COCON_G00170920 [Conger conger]|uniref:Uncharacterized protein n=1 Tax=Conger conger TaxID=82655 RepID=A0A9Q1D8I2_CONCO|nr:hypothetical protein COCON_G00170920 [Conger conger]
MNIVPLRRENGTDFAPCSGVVMSAHHRRIADLTAHASDVYPSGAPLSLLSPPKLCNAHRKRRFPGS